jgi:hypothetical protein
LAKQVVDTQLRDAALDAMDRWANVRVTDPATFFAAVKDIRTDRELQPIYDRLMSEARQAGRADLQQVDWSGAPSSELIVRIAAGLGINQGVANFLPTPLPPPFLEQLPMRARMALYGDWWFLRACEAGISPTVPLRLLARDAAAHQPAVMEMVQRWNQHLGNVVARTRLADEANNEGLRRETMNEMARRVRALLKWDGVLQRLVTDEAVTDSIVMAVYEMAGATQAPSVLDAISAALDGKLDIIPQRAANRLEADGARRHKRSKIEILINSSPDDSGSDMGIGLEREADPHVRSPEELLLAKEKSENLNKSLRNVLKSAPPPDRKRLRIAWESFRSEDDEKLKDLAARHDITPQTLRNYKRLLLDGLSAQLKQ